MENICAIIDFQGFKINKNLFIPREMAISSDSISMCMEINPELDLNDFETSEQNIIKFITHNINGLHIKPFNDVNYCYIPKQNEIGEVLSLWYNLVSSTEKPLVACINDVTRKILSENNIPYLDLSDPALDFPSYKQIKIQNQTNYLCGYHKSFAYKSPNKFICAYRKCAQVYKVIKERLKAFENEWFVDE